MKARNSITRALVHALLLFAAFCGISSGSWGGATGSGSGATVSSRGCGCCGAGAAVVEGSAVGRGCCCHEAPDTVPVVPQESAAPEAPVEVLAAAQTGEDALPRPPLVLARWRGQTLAFRLQHAERGAERCVRLCVQRV